jgi:EAL domain-containing protein (putative c-di-GMP-specific phosphodiesterase class I)/CHASE2 domain-containing sensor protein
VGRKADVTRIFGKSFRSARGNGFVLLACILSLFFGIFEVGKPLDQLMRTARDKIRSKDASGQIVLVAIDSKSLYEGGRWPWPRSDQAKILDELQRLGAKRVFFDLNFADPTTEAEDAAFEAALKRSKVPTYLQARFVVDPTTNERTEVVPLQRFAQNSSTVSNTVKKDVFGAAWAVPASIAINGKSIPAIGSTLANRSFKNDQKIPVDFSIDPRSVPLISAIDVLKERAGFADVRGKDVVISPTTSDIEEHRTLPGYGARPRVYTQILAAETLLRGNPIEIGWLPFWILSFVVVALYGIIRRTTTRRSLFMCSMGLIFVVPIFLEGQQFFLQIVPALLLLLLFAGDRVWARFKSALHKQGITNVVSGLKNLNAFRELDVLRDTVLVVANVRNFASIRSALPSEQERELVDEITKRLTVGSEQIELYQGDDGVFAWLMDTHKAGNVGDHVEAIHSFFRSPLIVGGRAIQLHVTFGVDQDDTRLLPNRMGTALVASQQAEKTGRRWLMSDAETSKEVEWKLDLIGRLDTAINNGELWVAYQPKLDLATRRICGAEALVRWTHPERGQLAPDEFVTLAEEQNCIGNLTAFVLSNAIQLAARINSHGIRFGVAVNLSPRVTDGVSIDMLAKGLLDRYGLEPSLLTLEVTETAAMLSGDEFLALLHRLRALGIRISVDDYGSGLSTLGYIRTIPATELKIDKSFIKDIELSEEDQVMVRSTVDMAHSLGRIVVAEGVESAATLETLTQLGCDKAQGYYISRPVPVRQLFRQILKDGEQKAA